MESKKDYYTAAQFFDKETPTPEFKGQIQLFVDVACFGFKISQHFNIEAPVFAIEQSPNQPKIANLSYYRPTGALTVPCKLTDCTLVASFPITEAMRVMTLKVQEVAKERSLKIGELQWMGMGHTAIVKHDVVQAAETGNWRYFLDDMELMEAFPKKPVADDFIDLHEIAKKRKSEKLRTFLEKLTKPAAK